MLTTVEEEDKHLLRAMEESNAESISGVLRRWRTRTNLRAASVIHPMFELTKCSGGSSLAYEQWHERSTRSAVTYSSVAYYDIAV